uniref:Secreted protein n=1 Tax=Haemonchus contortus TaxID=6289 RepID=A0A7I5EBJ8_HAECO
MISQISLLSSLVALAAAQLCPSACLQTFNTGCGRCSGIRAYRLPPPPMMMLMPPPPLIRPVYNPCGGLPCAPQTQYIPPCGGGGCGNIGQQTAYGIPDPIITESGRVIQAPFQPPPSLPPPGVQQTNYSPGK